MIKTLVLDDGYHGKDVVIFDKGCLKMGLASFIGNIAQPHVKEYWIRTIHYEDIEEDASAELFENLNRMPYGKHFGDDDYEGSFDRLFRGPDVVDGCDIY